MIGNKFFSYLLATTMALTSGIASEDADARGGSAGGAGAASAGRAATSVAARPAAAGAAAARTAGAARMNAAAAARSASANGARISGIHRAAGLPANRASQGLPPGGGSGGGGKPPSPFYTFKDSFPGNGKGYGLGATSGNFSYHPAGSDYSPYPYYYYHPAFINSGSPQPKEKDDDIQKCIKYVLANQMALSEADIQSKSPKILSLRQKFEQEKGQSLSVGSIDEDRLTGQVRVAYKSCLPR